MSMSVFFFFQAEDGIRDKLVTGVQTCALPIWHFRIGIETERAQNIHVEAGTDRDPTVFGRIHRESYWDFSRGAKDMYHLGPASEFPKELTLVMKKADFWKVKRLRIWAFKVGGEAQYGLILDKTNLEFSNGQTYRFPVTEPPTLGFRPNPFK